MSQTNVTARAATRSTGAWPGGRTRQQDLPLLTGTAQFMDDVTVPGMLHMVVLRSTQAHARIDNIDASAALSLPGVHAVITGRDIAGQVNPQPVVWTHIPNQHESTGLAMAVDRVRYAGQVVAAVAAESRAIGEDAIERISVHYSPLPVVLTIAEATAPGAPILHEDWGSNVFGDLTYEHGEIDSVWDQADVVVSETLSVGRQFACPLETRGCLANWDRYTGDVDITISAQSPNRVREFLGEVLRVPVHAVRVRVPSLGGGFGLKADFYGDEVLCCLLSRRTGRPVKYIEDRVESFQGSAHAREQQLDVALAARRDGTIIGLRGTVTAVLGGEIGSTGMGPAWLGAIMMPGPYKIPNIELTIRGVVTNKAPYGAYRGWGQPKGNFAMERIMDRLARELDLSPAEVRRRNFVAPSEFPHFNGIVSTYDSGRYEDCLDLALQEVELRRWADRRHGATEEGRTIGYGFACYVESTAAGPSRTLNKLGLDQSGFDSTVVRMDSTGGVTLYTGQTDMGQGIMTALADVCARELGMPRDDVRVILGDTTTCPYTGYGTGGSRAGALAGTSAQQAATMLRRKVLKVAADILGHRPSDLTIREGMVRLQSDPSEPLLSLEEIGRAAYRGVARLAPDTSPTLQATAVFDPISQAYANGIAATLVEIDRATGRTEVLEYFMVHDCGTIINPTIVEGQIQGGAMQAIAGALFEEIVYDDAGRIINTDFVDYNFPSATEIPRIDEISMETPSPVIPGGMKGVGEAGVIPGAAAIASAIDDALRHDNVFIRRVPMTPERLYRELHSIA